MSNNNRTYVDLFNFKESGTGANVDIITIEEGTGEDEYRHILNTSYNRQRASSPFRDRVQERYNRSLSPTGSPRLKRKIIPRSVSPAIFHRSSPNNRASPTKLATISPVKSPSKLSPSKPFNSTSLNSTVPNNDSEEIRRLRFENLILQSKVETLETENKSLKESAPKHHKTPADNRSQTRELSQLKLDLAAALRQIEKLKRENDDLTSQLYSLKVDRLENPKKPSTLQRDEREDWTGCQADAIEHLCSENQRLRETIFDMNEQKLHVHRLLEQQGTVTVPRTRSDSCQIENEQLTEEKKRLLARMESENEEAKKTLEKYSKLKEDYNAALAQISSLQAQVMKYEKEGLDKSGIESNTVKALQERMDKREEEFSRQLKDKETELQNRIDMHVLKLQDIEDEIRRVSHVCDMMCQEKDNAIQTLQKQINTNAILSRSNEHLQKTVNEQSDRIRDFVYRQMRDTELINELKTDFEAVLKERNELDERLRHDTQVHLQRLATLREQINIARLSFSAITHMLQHGGIDNEKREELLKQLAQTDSQLSTLQREIMDMERLEAEHTKVDLDDFTIQFLKKSEQCEALQTQLSAMELDRSRLNKKQDEMEGSLDETKRALTEQEEEWDNMRQQLHKKQVEIDTLRRQLNKVKVKLGIVEDDRDVCEAKSRDLKADKEKLCDDTNHLNEGLTETKKKLHQKELQKGVSRSTIQIGLLNEDMRVAIRALLDLNKEIDSEALEEHLEALHEVSSDLEKLELALEKTLGSQYSLEMPLRGKSGEKISQLLQELDFCRETIDQLQGKKRRYPNDGTMTGGSPDQQSAYKRLQHQLECASQERLHLSSQLKLATEQARMYKETLSEKEKQLMEAEDIAANIQEQFEPVTGPSKTRHKPIYPLTMSPENMRSIIEERDELVRTLKFELKRCSAQTKAVITQNSHCNEMIGTHKTMIRALQQCLDDNEVQYSLLLSSYHTACGDRIRQIYDTKCEQTDPDPLFDALCKTADGTDSNHRHDNESDRLKKVVKALKKALDEEVAKRKGSSLDYDNLKADIRKLAVKLESDGQLYIPTADADIQTGVSQRDGMCQTYLPGQTPSKLSKGRARSESAGTQQDEYSGEGSGSPEQEEEEEEETEEMPAELGEAADLWKAKRQSQKHVKKLVRENIKLKDELARSVGENEEMRSKIKMLLRGDPSALAAELEKTLTSNTENRKVIAELLNDKENLSDKMDSDLQPKIAALTAETEQLKETLATLKHEHAVCERERKQLLDEKNAFKPEPPGSTEDGDVLKENIRLQTKVHNLYQETLQLKFKNKAAKDQAGMGFGLSTEECTAKERISTLEEMSEKIENSLSTSYDKEDCGALKEQVLDLQNALQDALDTIKSHEHEEAAREAAERAKPPVAAAEAADEAAPPAVEEGEAPQERSEKPKSIREQESRTTQTEVPAGPTRVQLLVKIAIIGTKLTHRTKQIEALEGTVKEKERAIEAKDEEVKGREETITEMQEKIKIKEAELDENRTEIATFQEKMDEFEKILAAKQKEIEDLVFQAEEEASKTASAGANLEDVTAWKTKYAEIKAQKKKLQGAINFANKTLEEYKVNVDMLTGKVVQHDEDMNAFFATITDALKNDPICSNKNFGYISEKDKLASAKNIISKFIEFTTQFTNKTEELTKDIKVTKEKLTTTSDKADDLVKKLDNITGDLERTKNILETSQLELSQKTTELNKIKAEFDKLQLGHDNITAELYALRAEHDKAVGSKEQLENQAIELQKKLENAAENIAEKDNALAEKEKEVDDAKSQLKTLSEEAPPEAPPESDEGEEEELEEDEQSKEKSLKSVSKSSKASKQESAKQEKSALKDKAILKKLCSIEKEVSGINRDILKTKTAINDLNDADDEEEEDDEDEDNNEDDEKNEKKKALLETLNSLLDRMSEKTTILASLCAENGIKSRPRKTRGGQTDYTISPADEVEMPGQVYDKSEQHSSTNTLSQVSEITDKSTPVGNLRIHELEEQLQQKDCEIKELTEQMEAGNGGVTPTPRAGTAEDDPESHDFNYWKDKAVRLTNELNTLKEQLKSQEASAQGDLDEQLRNLQEQLEEDRIKQQEIQESIKNCQEDQKQDQEQLQQTLVANIEEKQKAVSELMAKIKNQQNEISDSQKQRADVKSEIEKTIGESAQTYADLQSKFQTQVSQRDDEILQLKGDLRENNKTKSDTQRELDDKIMEVERLDNKVRLLEQDLNDDSRTYKAFKQEIYELKDIIEDKSKKVKTLENQLHALNNTVQKSGDNADLAIKRMREAELARHEVSERSLDQQRKADEELKAKDKSVRDAAAKAKAMEAQIDSLKNVLVKKHECDPNENALLELDIDPEIAKTMNNEDLLEKIKKLSEQLLETERKRIDLKVDFKAALCELEGLNGLLEEKERDRDGLVKLVAQLRRELDRLRAEDSAQSLRSDQSQYQFYTDEEYNELQDELQKMAGELRAADDQKKSSHKQRKQEKAQFERMRVELARRIEEYACLLAVHNKLENSIANLEDQCMHKGLESEQHRVEVLSLKDGLLTIQQNADKVEDMCRSKNVEIENLKGEMTQYINDVKSLTNDIERLHNEHESERSIWSRSLKELEEDRNNLLKKIESISTTAMSQGSKRNSNVDHAKRFVNILKDLNQERITSATANQRLEFTAQQNEITDLRRKLELTDNKRSHLVHELKRCECELQETRDGFDMKLEENRAFVNQMSSLNSKLAKFERKMQDATAGLKHERQCGELLLEENRHLYADKEKYELTVEELNTNLKYLLTELEVSNSKVNTISEKLAHCEGLTKNLQKANKLKTGDNFELVELNAHLIEKLHAHEPVDVISEELDELRQQIQPDRGLTEMMYEIEILQNDKSRLENEIKLIKCKEDELVKAEKTKQELKFIELQNKMAIMSSNNDGTKEFIVNLNSENNDLKNQMYELQYQVEKAEDRLTEKDRQVSKLRSKVDKSLHSLPRSPEPDQGNINKIETLKDDLSKLNQTIKQLERENKDLHKTISRRENEYTTAVDQTKYYEEIIGELNNEIGKHERDAEDNQKETLHFSSQFNDAKNQLTTLAEENWDLTDRLAEVSESNENKDVINGELKKKCEVLENKLSVLTLEHSALVNEMEEVAGELDRVEEDTGRRKQLDETVQEVLEQNERMAEENERLQAEVRGKETAFNNLKRAQSSDKEIKHQLKLLKEENGTLQEELQKVQASCKKLAQENSRLSEASSALQMISVKVKDLKENNEKLKKAVKKELTRDEARYLTHSFMDRIIKKLNDHIPEEINRLQSLLSSKELDIQRLEVEVSSLHGELLEADRVLISHNMKNSPAHRVDNRELYEAMKEAAIANRKVKILENQLEDCKVSLREMFDENKALSNILKEAESIQEEISNLHTPPSVVSLGSVGSSLEKDADLKEHVKELQQQLEETHEELARAKNHLSLSKQNPDGKFICARCKNLISSMYSLDEGALRELVDQKDREIVDTEQDMERLKGKISELEARMRSTHHGPGSSMVSLSRETYALKRKLRQNDSTLKDLWKEREECCVQLRAIDPHKLATPQSKFSKSDVIKELKWKFEGGSPPNDVKELKKENEELRGHIMEMTDYLCDQKWHDDLNALRNENDDLKTQLQELSDYMDDQVSPDNDVKSSVDKALSALRERHDVTLSALRDEHDVTTSALQEEVARVREYHAELARQLEQCCEQCEQFTKYRSNTPRDALKKHNTKLRKIVKSLEEFKSRASHFGIDQEKELKIYILRTGEVRVKCGAGGTTGVRVAQVQGCPDSPTEREQWCRELEDAAQIIRERKAPPRTSSPKRSPSPGKSQYSSMSSIAEDRVLLKLVLQLPSALNCSIEVE